MPRNFNGKLESEYASQYTGVRFRRNKDTHRNLERNGWMRCADARGIKVGRERPRVGRHCVLGSGAISPNTEMAGRGRVDGARAGAWWGCLLLSPSSRPISTPAPPSTARAHSNMSSRRGSSTVLLPSGQTMATFTKHSQDEEGLPHATKKYVRSPGPPRRPVCDRCQSQDNGGPSPQV